MTCIGSWNACLGAFNKIDYLAHLLNSENVDVLFVQEAEVSRNMDKKMLGVRGYNLYYNQEKEKARIICYVKDCAEVEIEVSSKVDAISVKSAEVTIVGVYRPFKLTTHQTHMAYLKDLIEFTKKCGQNSSSLIVVGDFNLDFAKRHDRSYNRISLYDAWEECTTELGLIQLINKPTWSRTVRNTKKSSILDHAYINNLDHQICESVVDTNHSDHMAVIIRMATKLNRKGLNRIRLKNWRQYSKQRLQEELAAVDWNQFQHLGAEGHSNRLEEVLTKIHDRLVPDMLLRRCEEKYVWSTKIITLKRKKKNLLKKARQQNRAGLLDRVKEIDKRIRFCFKEESRNKIRKTLDARDPRSFWKAVESARGSDHSGVPEMMKLDGRKITQNSAKASTFASIFTAKVNAVRESTRVDPGVYNGRQEIFATDCNFFTEDLVKEVIMELKDSKSFGPDRIPMVFYRDGTEQLTICLVELFQKIYYERKIPDQWKCCRILPLFKKGDRAEFANYRPIANLCSIAKIFEKCMLKRMLKVAEESGVDLTGEEQHGFKKNRSTVTAGLSLQHAISSALDEGQIAGCVSLDLSSAFDVVNQDLLIKRMKILGLPPDVCSLVEEWLKDRSAYVEIGQDTSDFFCVDDGTIQGSVMGPILFSIFIRPLLQMSGILAYADDNYIIETGNNIEELKQKLSNKVTEVIEWMKQSGLSVNIAKTELVFFHRNQKLSESLNFGTLTVNSKESMKILGIWFDCNLNWSCHVHKLIESVKKECYGLRKLRNYFSFDEMKQICTAFAFSKFYYGCQIWFLPTLHKSLQQKLLSLSTLILRSAFFLHDWKISNVDIHTLVGRATPFQYCKYSHAIAMFNVFKNECPSNVWLNAQFNFIFLERKNQILFVSNNSSKVGYNSLSNRFSFVCHALDFDWMSLSLSAMKSRCKRIFLT